MVLTALRGALGFLTRLPVGRDEDAWTAFTRTPVAFPLAGYVVGVVLAAPFAVVAPGPTAAFAFLAWAIVVTGVNHADGLADLGDAAVVHGDPEERRDVMRDTTVGVGALLALGLGLLGLALAGLELAAMPLRAAVGLVVTAEVGTKLAVVALVCFGDASHDGFGAAFTAPASPRDLALPMAVAAPSVLASGSIAVGLGSLAAALVVAVIVHRWTDRRLGGVGGDVFGATNELARVAALHAGVIAWTLW